MKKLALAILSLACYGASAQNTHLDYKYAVKLSALTTIAGNEQVYTDSTFTRTAMGNRIAHPAPAVQVATSKNNFHEIELSDLTINRSVTLMERNSAGQTITIGGDSTTMTSIALRYEYIRMFGKKKDARLVPAIGFAVMPYFTSYKTTPVIISTFPLRDNTLGLRGFITPRLTYYINKRLFADINIPVNLFDMQQRNSRTLNSAKSEEQGTASTFNFNALPAYYSFRLGVGVKL